LPKIKKVKPGDVLYDVRRASWRSNFGSSRWDVWDVRVIEVDPENDRVLVSWNTNTPRWISGAALDKYKWKRPES
jgi:hypothetical protein